MILRLTITNAMPVPVEFRSNVASNQPLQPNQDTERSQHKPDSHSVTSPSLIRRPGKPYAV